MLSGFPCDLYTSKRLRKVENIALSKKCWYARFPYRFNSRIISFFDW